MPGCVGQDARSLPIGLMETLDFRQIRTKQRAVAA
jgi:hypothetical protein